MSTIEFIEACRNLQLSKEDWFFGLAAAATKALGARGIRGVGGYSYRVASDGLVQIIDMIHPSGSELAEHPEYGKGAFLMHINQGPLRASFADPNPSTLVLSQTERGIASSLRERLPPQGVDSVGLLGGTFLGEGINLCWLLDHELKPSLRQSRYFRALAGHLSTGYRVRQVVSKLSSVVEAPEAVLAPNGEIVHATAWAHGAQRTRIAECLVAAVRGVERMRTRASSRSVTDPELLFSAYVAGEYALVDQIDTDGKRWLVAVRVKGGEPLPAALSLREQRVAAAAARELSNKEIAAELDISPRTVAYDLRSCLAKLGLPNRAALAQKF